MNNLELALLLGGLTVGVLSLVIIFNGIQEDFKTLDKILGDEDI